MIKKALAILAFLSVFAIPVMAQTNTSIIIDNPPYTEPATYVDVKTAYLDEDSQMILNATVNFEFNATNYTMPYDEIENAYKTTVYFNPADVGDWNFTVYANKTGYYSQTEERTIKVRQPIYVTLSLYQDNNQTAYKDNFGQVVMKSNYTCFPYVTYTRQDTYSGETLYYTDCYYHVNYTSGIAQLKVYEKGKYAVTFISGYMSYSNTFAYPTVERQNYKLELGEFTVEESPTNINLVLTSCELNPEQCQRFYTSVFLWVAFLIIAGVTGIVAGKFGGAGVGFGVGFLVLIGLVLLRFALLGY